jgi:hypothetical protein
MKILCILYYIEFEDMGDYQLVVTVEDSNGKNVKHFLDMRLRVNSDYPRVSFYQESPFYQADRFVVRFLFIQIHFYFQI